MVEESFQPKERKTWETVPLFVPLEQAVIKLITNFSSNTINRTTKGPGMINLISILMSTTNKIRIKSINLTKTLKNGALPKSVIFMYVIQINSLKCLNKKEIGSQFLPFRPVLKPNGDVELQSWFTFSLLLTVRILNHKLSMITPRSETTKIW